ncbi:ABC transporter permease [Actinoplanes utahensis]|uniref:Uncharacterized protein n=1 Tax=Actinoplanes utahensis TaxID=1869 RepID=A0A0A6UKI4_ACTUT|nr:hypothetical protein [Actinoplanes utahensis]KHD74794.1 hypothetical protein MB27_26540 [Actinoplanes utahensis]GIF35183.1 hypothetical protein Aut01nite_81690 [Actinoplanes utahensis]
MAVRDVIALTTADFRDRVRRPAYAVILLAAVALGYLAAPEGDARWVVMYIGEYRGVYNSAYTGTLIALTSALWLTLGGFYVVRNGVSRDRSTGVGQLIAATPMPTVRYLAGKFLSSCLVLSSMVGVLAVTALILQLARGEETAVEPVALLTPFVVMALPLVAFTAGMALLFETVPLLRAGLGNIVWFVVWMVVAIGGQSPDALFGGIGVHEVAASMAHSMTAQGIDMTGGGFSLGLVYLDEPLKVFVWDGLDISAGYLAGRLAMVLLALLVALAPALWFTRFDPARRHGPAPEPFMPMASGGGHHGIAAPVRPEVAAPAIRSLPAPERGGAYGRLVAGELRILVQGVSRWWWLGVLAIMVAGLALPLGAVTQFVLPVGWIWPVLVWSRLGTQRVEYGVDGILGAYPWSRRRLVAEWGAGVVLTLLTGLAPLIRMLAGGDTAGASTCVAGALFIPSLALAMGVLSRTHRLFQAFYLLWWYATINGIAAVDVMGAVRENGAPAGPGPLLVTAGAVVLVAVTLLTGAARRNVRT